MFALLDIIHPSKNKNEQQYMFFAEILHYIWPEILPGFCFGWL